MKELTRLELAQLEIQRKEKPIAPDFANAIMEMIFFQFKSPGKKMPERLIQQLRSCLREAS